VVEIWCINHMAYPPSRGYHTYSVYYCGRYCGTRSRPKNVIIIALRSQQFSVNMINVFFFLNLQRATDKKYVRKRRSVDEGQLGYLFHEQ